MKTLNIAILLLKIRKIYRTSTQLVTTNSVMEEYPLGAESRPFVALATYHR